MEDFELNLMVEIYENKIQEWKNIGLNPLQIEEQIKIKFSLEELEIIKSRLHLNNGRMISIKKEEIDIDELKDDNNKILPYKVAKKLIEKIKMITTFDNEQMFVYDGKIYVSDCKGYIKDNIERMLGEFATINMINETTNHLQNLTRIERAEIDKNKDLIWCKNGILNVKNKEFKDFSSEIISTSLIPVKYIPGIDCPKIKKFLEEVIDKNDIPLVQEFIGYCLHKNYEMQKAIMLLGTGENGKSTLIDIIVGFLGKENISTTPLHELIYNRFASASLYRKLANLVSETPSTKLKDANRFKNLTGGDYIRCEEKYMKSFEFKNYAKMMFATNSLPETEDLSTAFFRRWIVIKFPNRFVGNDKIPDLANKLMTEEELSGLLNWALEGLNRLFENKKFSETSTMEQIQEEWIRNSDSLRAFVNGRVNHSNDDNVFVQKSEFYEKYQEYCEENNLTADSMQMVGRRLPEIIHTLEISPLVAGKRIRAWKGLKFKDESSIDDGTLFKF